MMASMNFNVKSAKKCAFCKYWYDPTNSGIEPVSPRISLWKIRDLNQKCMCLKKNFQMSASATCGKFELKL